MTSPAPIGPNSIITRNEKPVAVEVDRTVVMMSLDQGMYFGLEGTGPKIWALLDRPRSVTQLCEELMKEFDIDADSCRREVCGFLEELRRAELVLVYDEETGPVRPTPGS